MQEEIRRKLAEFEAPGSMLDEIEEDAAPTALASGFASVDAGMYLRAGQPDLVIVAARPSDGKSAMLCQLAFNVSLKYPVHLFSLEMDRKQVKGRLVRLADGADLAG